MERNNDVEGWFDCVLKNVVAPTCPANKESCTLKRSDHLLGPNGWEIWLHNVSLHKALAWWR